MFRVRLVGVLNLLLLRGNAATISGFVMAPFVSDELPATPPWWFLERKSALRTIARSPSMVVNNRSVFFSLLWASFPRRQKVESRVEPNVVCQLLNVESRQNVGEVRTQLLPVKVGNVVLVCNGRLATFPFLLLQGRVEQLVCSSESRRLDVDISFETIQLTLYSATGSEVA